MLLWCLLVAVLLIVFFLVFSVLFTHTPHGDIKNYFTDRKLPKSEKKLIKRLYKLALYNHCKVRWQYYLLLSFIVAVVVLFLIDAFSLVNLIIIIAFVFLAMDIMFRFERTHVYGEVSNEATRIYAKLNH